MPPSYFLRLSGKAFASRKGQTLVEYALILAIITVVAIGTFAQLGAVVVTVFSSINTVLDTATTSH